MTSTTYETVLKAKHDRIVHAYGYVLTFGGDPKEVGEAHEQIAELVNTLNEEYFGYLQVSHDEMLQSILTTYRSLYPSVFFVD